MLTSSMTYTSSRHFFFFQAEDGIRDRDVTGVQTCALPICPPRRPAVRPGQRGGRQEEPAVLQHRAAGVRRDLGVRGRVHHLQYVLDPGGPADPGAGPRSEERRVGKGCWAPWSTSHVL